MSRGTIKRVLAGIFMVSAGICFYIDSYNVVPIFPEAEFSIRYPRLILGVWIFASALYSLVPLKKAQVIDIQNALPMLAKHFLNMVVYIVLLRYLGFVFSTFVFFWLFFYLFGHRDYGRFSVISLACSVLVWSIFEVVLKLSLPAGSLIPLFWG